jgi:hypothetical protein
VDFERTERSWETDGAQREEGVGWIAEDWRGTMQSDSDISELNIFYIAGIGCGDSGEGSAYAWIEGKTKKSLVEEFDGMTANAAK